MFNFEIYKDMLLNKTGDCTRLILRDSSGEVVFFAAELSNQGHYIMGKKGDDGFEQLLQAFKITDKNNASNSENI